MAAPKVRCTLSTLLFMRCSLDSIVTDTLLGQLELKNGSERDDQAKMKKMKMANDAKRKIVDDRKDDRTKV